MLALKLWSFWSDQCDRFLIDGTPFKVVIKYLHIDHTQHHKCKRSPGAMQLKHVFTMPPHTGRRTGPPYWIFETSDALNLLEQHWTKPYVLNVLLKKCRLQFAVLVSVHYACTFQLHTTTSCTKRLIQIFQYKTVKQLSMKTSQVAC